jgi:GT2 family glycosyltransferase
VLGTIIVNYKTDDEVIRYVTEELVKVHTSNKIVIVNNASTTESDKKIAEGCGAYWVSEQDKIDTTANIFVLGMGENLGYARGNNAGANFLLRHFKPEYLLFSNSDLYYYDDDVIDRLIAKMEKVPDIGLVGPCIENVSGQRQGPNKLKSVWKLYIIPQMFYPFIPGGIRRKLAFPTPPGATEGYYDYLNGSIFLARTKAFKQAGMFDERTFLYSEEPILASRINKAGFRIYYFDKVKVIHEHSYTTKKLDIAWKVLKYHRQSNRYYLQNYRKINMFELMMFDLSCWIYTYIWYPLLVIRQTTAKFLSGRFNKQNN